MILSVNFIFTCHRAFPLELLKLLSSFNVSGVLCIIFRYICTLTNVTFKISMFHLQILIMIDRYFRNFIFSYGSFLNSKLYIINKCVYSKINKFEMEDLKVGLSLETFTIFFATLKNISTVSFFKKYLVQQTANINCYHFVAYMERTQFVSQFTIIKCMNSLHRVMYNAVTIVKVSYHWKYFFKRLSSNNYCN